MALINTDTRTTAITRYREYYRTNKYLGGLIKVSKLVYREKAGDEYHIHLPVSSHCDKIYINGVEFKSPKDKYND